MRTGDLHQQRCGQSGFGYILVLFAIAAMGLLMAGAGQVWHTTAQREKEAELLLIGNQFRQAITRYHENSPEAAQQYPETLQNLLEDRRFPTPQRHLRQIYRDPMTGHSEWGLIKLGGRIVGVHSLSTNKPFRQVFDERDAALTSKQHYNEWVFGDALFVDTATALPLSPASAPTEQATRR